MYFSMSAAPLPNRPVTIFTSSRCETSLGMGGRPFRRCLSAIFGQKVRDVFRVQFVVKCVIYLDGRCPGARPDALDFLQRKDAVRRNALVPDSEFLLEAFENVVGSTQHATDVCADLHVEFAHGFEKQKRGKKKEKKKNTKQAAGVKA